MRNTLKIIFVFLLMVSIVKAQTLWEFFNGDLPSVKERSNIYSEVGNDVYKGTREQNIKLLSFLEQLTSPSLGSLAFPPSTVEGTSTAGWTDDGSIVRLNTSSDFVGVGTNNPSEKLSVVGGNTYISGDVSISGGEINFGSSGGATTTFTQLDNGNLGLASTTPRASFGLGGSLMVASTTTTELLTVNATSTFVGTTTFNGVNYRWSSSLTASNYLTTDAGGQLSWGNPSATFSVLIPSTSALASADTERAATSATYIKLKELVLAIDGAATLSFDLKRTVSGTAYGQLLIYRMFHGGSLYTDGLVTTFIDTEAAGSYTTYTHQISASSTPLRIELWGKNTDGGATTATVRNFRILGSVTATSTAYSVAD